MDISRLRDKYVVVLPYPHGDGGEEVTVEYLPFDASMTIRKDCTAITFIKGRRVDIFDDVRFASLVAVKCVKALKGFTSGGVEVTATPDVVEMLARRDYDFARFVMNAAMDHKLMESVNRAREEREKNSGDTSGQG